MYLVFSLHRLNAWYSKIILCYKNKLSIQHQLYILQYSILFGLNQKPFTRFNLLCPCFLNDNHGHYSLALNIRLIKTSYFIVESNFCCPQCGKGYKYHSSLSLHLKFRCGVEPKFTCEDCMKRFSFKHHLRRHMLSVHNTIC